MALIQIRDVPEPVYETIRRRARRSGQSIQAYMLAQTVELASRPSVAEVIDRLEAELAERPALAVDGELLLADIRADRA